MSSHLSIRIKLMQELSGKQTLQLANGTTIAYQRSPGRRPGVIFLGGFMSDMTGTKATTLETWCHTHAQAFVRFDYSGHGASSGRFRDGTIGAWTEEAIAVFDHLSKGPQILVGSSMGGWIMLLVALARPERIAGLLSVACAVDFTEHMLWQSLDTATRLQLQRDGLIYLPSEYDQEAPYPITLKLIEEARHHLLLERQRLSITCPVRLLHGMRDADVPWQISIQVAERLASDNVRVVLVKDGEHRMSREQDLKLLTDLLGELIAEV
jgi:pimeloyl-ACP methyl ester carboxylesterase